MHGDGERLGVLGGTFDPPHIGHLVAAVEARHQLGLDRVLLVVANRPWQKTATREIGPTTHRVEMTRLLIEGVEKLEVSTIEVDRGGDSYTVDTLEDLAALDPGGQRFLIVGGDAVAGLSSWHRGADLAGLAVLVVVDRAGHETALPGRPWRTERVAIPQLEVSSADLRARLAAGRPVEGLMPPTVVSYVRRHRLYGERP